MNTFPVPADEPIGSQGPLAGAGPEGAGAGSACPAPALTSIPVRAMEDVMQARALQVVKYGHTLEADQRRPLGDFARDLESLARAIREDVQWHKPAEQIRRRTVKLGALCLALIDRINGAHPESQDHG